MIVLQHARPPPHPEHPAFPSAIAMGKRPVVLPTQPHSPKRVALAAQPPSFEVLKDDTVEQDPSLEELCKPLSCKLCNVTLNSAQQAQAHYQVRTTDSFFFIWMLFPSDTESCRT